jgi:hypothetical protein
MDLTELKRNDTASGKRHPWELTRARIISFFIKDISPVRHIADVGSGDAFVLQCLQKKKYADKYTAIDTAYTENILEGLRERGALNIGFRTTIKDAAPAEIILLADVLEHCADDAEVLKEIVQSAVSAPGATFVVMAPAMKGLYSQHDQLLGHHRRYDRKQLVRLCESQQLAVLVSGYFFFCLLPFRAMTKLLEKTGLKKTVRSVDNWTKGKLLTNFISLILWLDFRLCHALASTGIHIPGLSCYCVCQKPPS